MPSDAEKDLRLLPHHSEVMGVLPELSHSSHDRADGGVVVHSPAEAVEHELILMVERTVSLSADMNR